MKQIVPFTRKINFDTPVDEITSISLDKKIKNIKDSIISGVFELYLEYKESDISVTTLKYNSSIPFDIDIDDKYLLDNVKVDIDDFYYEIEDDGVILHIDVLIDNLEYNEEEINNVTVKSTERETEDITPKQDFTDFEKIVLTDEKRNDCHVEIEDLFKELDEKIEDVSVKKNPIFESFDPKNETYVTYNVHIVREEDNIDSICLKYGVTKEEISYYNDISIIKLGDKLIVPSYKK